MSDDSRSEKIKQKSRWEMKLKVFPDRNRVIGTFINNENSSVYRYTHYGDTKT